MAVNAYSRGPVAPQFTSNYLSQHVDAPFEAINAALQNRQEEYNHWLEGSQTLHQGLMGIQAATNSDAEYLKKAQKDYEAQINQYSGQDLSRPEVQRGLQSLATTIAGDKTLQGIQATHARVGELQAQYKALEKDGKGYTPQAQLMASQLAQYDQGGGAAAGQSFQGEDFQPALNHTGKAQEYYKALNPNEVEGIRSIATQDGDMAYKIGQAGINSGQIYGAYTAALGDWLSSPEGKQVAQQALAQGATPQKAAQYAAQFLLGQGKNMIYSKSSTNQDVAMRELQGQRHSDRKAKEKDEKENPGPTFMPYGQFKPDLGKEQQFDQQGNIITNPGVIESFGAGYGAGAQADLPLSTKLAMGATGAYQALFGSTADKRGLSTLIGYKTDNLEKSLELRNQAAALMGKPQVSAKEHYNNLNVFQPTEAPVLTSKKGLGDANAQVVESGIIKGMVIHDDQGSHHYNDLIKEGDEITVTTDPNTAWQTPYSAQTIGATITSKDGKSRQVFIDGGSQYDYLQTPRSEQDVKAKNARLLNQAKTHGYARGMEWQWDEKTHRAIPVGEKEGVYDPSLSETPLFRKVGN